MKKYVFGADVGGTTVKLGLFTTEGTLLDKWEIPTDTSAQGDILGDIAAACEAKIKEKGLEKEEFAGIGMGLPGPVKEDGSVEVCVNLGWGSRQVKEEMEALLGLPAAVGNDANVAALGEAWQGGAKGHANVVMVTLGTGVGGGIIVGGKVIAGAHGGGGEIGHMMMNTHETEHCGCGKTGCLEQYCSATGIVKETKKAMEGQTVNSVLAGKDPLTSKDIFDAAREGDGFAVEQVDIFAKRLARGLSFISCVVDPEIFVIGGGVSRAGDILIESVKKHYKTYAFVSHKETEFALASLGNDAGIYGCAKLIL